MRKLLFILITLFSTCNIFARTDYKNPIESEKIGTLIIQPNQYKEVERDLYLCKDKDNNYFIAINVNYFVKKNKDVLNIILNNNETFSLKLGKSFKQLKYFFYGNTFTARTTITTVGNYTTANTTVSRDKFIWYDFYSAYPITKEQYSLICQYGIKEISVDGIYKITLNLIK